MRAIRTLRIPLVVIALFCAYLTGNRIAHPFIDGDLFWQRQLGEFVLAHHALPTTLGEHTFTAPGAPWVAQEWLLGVLDALAFRAHALWTLSLLAGLAVFGALALTAIRAKRAGASLYATLAVMLFAGICLEGPFAIRAQVLAWPLLAALLLALDAQGYAPLWAIAVTMAWANLHASVMVAIPIVWLDAALFVLTYVLDRRGAQDARARTQRTKKRDLEAQPAIGALLRDRGVRIRAVLCVAVPLAVLCTPLGIRLPIYAVMLLHSPIRQFIAEWQPLDGLSTQIVAGLFPLVAIVLYGVRKLWRERPRDFVLTFLMAAWAFLSIRNIALFAIVAAVPASLAVSAGEGWEDPLDRVPARFAWLRSSAGGLVVWIASFALVALVGRIGYGAHSIVKPWTPPSASIAALAGRPGEHRLFCTDFSWCAVALGEPNVRIFLDGRADPYPVSVWKSFAIVSAMQPGWRQTLHRYRVNAVLAAKNDPLGPALIGTGRWRELSQADVCCTLFVKKTHLARAP